MSDQKKTGSTIKKEEEKLVNEVDLARFEADIIHDLLWYALTEFAHQQFYVCNKVAAWKKVAIQIKEDIKSKDISLVENLLLDGSFMEVTYNKYMTKFVDKYGNGVVQSELTSTCDHLLFKLHELRFKRYEFLTKLSEERYELIQREWYNNETAAVERKLILATKLEAINGPESLTEELKRKDKIIDQLTLENKGSLKTIDQLTLENKGLLKINEELKSTSKRQLWKWSNSK